MRPDHDQGHDGDQDHDDGDHDDDDDDDANAGLVCVAKGQAEQSVPRASLQKCIQPQATN